MRSSTHPPAPAVDVVAQDTGRNKKKKSGERQYRAAQQIIPLFDGGGTIFGSVAFYAPRHRWAQRRRLPTDHDASPNTAVQGGSRAYSCSGQVCVACTIATAECQHRGISTAVGSNFPAKAHHQQPLRWSSRQHRCAHVDAIVVVVVIVVCCRLHSGGAERRAGHDHHRQWTGGIHRRYVQ